MRKPMIDAHGRELVRTSTTMALAFAAALQGRVADPELASTVSKAVRSKRKGTKVAPAWKVTRAKRTKRPA